MGETEGRRTRRAAQLASRPPDSRAWPRITQVFPDKGRELKWSLTPHAVFFSFEQDAVTTAALTKPYLLLMAFLSLLVALASTCFATASTTSVSTSLPQECLTEYHAIQHSTSGEWQCFMVWGCEDSSGWAYTDKSFCFTSA